jgi:hypothetical protein
MKRVETPSKKRFCNRRLIIAGLFLAGFFFSTSQAFAATRYWVGGCSTTNWSCSDAGPVTNWGSVSNTRDNASVPGSSDDVFFDSNSSTSPSTLSANITINSLDMTGYTGTLTHNAATTLTIGGNGVVFKLASGMTYTLGAATAAITFTGTSGTTTITTTGKTVGNITFNGTGGWQLQDALTATSTGTITLTQGALDTKSQSITAMAFSSNNSNVRVLTMGSSTITLTGASNGWVSNGANMSITTNTATTTLTGQGGYFNSQSNTNFNGMSIVMTAVSSLYSQPPQNLTGPPSTSYTVNNLTMTGAATYTTSAFTLTNVNVTVSGTFTANGNSASNRILIFGGTLGTARTITAANVSVTNADFQDITGAGSGNWNLSAITGGSGDAGGNSGITFTASTTEYWVRNTGNWSGQNWSASSDGATTTGRVPLPQDTAKFDSNSFTTTGQTVTLDELRIGSVDWTGVTNNPTWAKNLGASSVYTIYGSTTLASGMTNTGTDQVNLYNRGNVSWASNGQTWTNPIVLNMIGGTLTLQSDFLSSSTITLTKGSLNANNYNVTATALLSNNSNTRTLTMGSGIWNMTGTGTVWDFTATSSLTLNANTATTTISDRSATAKTFIGGGLTWNNINFSGDNITATSSSTFNTLAVNNAGLPNGLKLASGLTQTVSNFVTNGSSGNLAKLVSTGSTAAILSKSSGTVSVNYMSIASSTATGGATWNAGSNSIDAGGNSGWTFGTTLTTPVVTIQAASSITATTTLLNASTTDTGGENDSVRGFQFGTTTSYGTATSTTGSYGTGTFSQTADNLLCNTLYHVRAYATNSLTTGYSGDTTFTTGACPTTFYVSPTGLATNNGSLQYPWTFTYALSGASSAIVAGDTVYLRGGTYTLATTTGQYGWTSTLAGTENAPIVVESYPGEWAILDGNLTGVATSSRNVTVLVINGNYTWFQNFEITNSETDDRVISDSGSNPTDRRGNSVDDRATGTKLIDLVLHDTGQGIGGWANGNDNEYYGNIVYNNGWDAPDRTHGHGIYTQNDTGWKYYENNVIVNSFDKDTQMYGSDASSLNNFTFEGNTWMNKTALFGGDSPINNLTIDKNYFYLSSFTIGYSNH